MAVRRYWFVIVVFGALLALSLPLYLTPGTSCQGEFCGVGVRSPEGVLGTYALARPGWLQVYWAAALLVAVGAVAWWYRRVGNLRRAVPCLVAAALLGVVTLWLTTAGWHGFRSASAVLESAQLLCFNGATPLLVSAVALLALAAGERSAPLLATAVGYGAVVYVAATYDSLYVLSRVGLPVDVMTDPWGVRQLLSIGVPAALLLAAGGAAFGVAAVRAQRAGSSMERISSTTA